MKIPIKVKRWIIVVRNKETNHIFVEDVAFKTIEKATEYSEIIKMTENFEVADIHPIIFFVYVETRANALFVEDNTTITFLKGDESEWDVNLKECL